MSNIIEMYNTILSDIMPNKSVTTKVTQNEDEHSGECEDCKRYGYLIREYACSDGYLYGLYCCCKMVCRDGCVYRCPNNHDCRVEKIDGWIDTIECQQCEHKFRPSFVWWGLSIPQAQERYG